MDLKNAIPGINDQSNSGNFQTVSKLRDLMNKIQEIKVERENIEKDLKKVNCDMALEFMKSQSENGIVNEEKLSTEKLEHLFSPLKTRIDQSIKSQETTMSEVEITNKRFVEERRATSGAAERDNLLKQLATASYAFFELENNLTEGTKVGSYLFFDSFIFFLKIQFYNDLTPLLVRLQQKVSGN